jgi:hypothetical protein
MTPEQYAIFDQYITAGRTTVRFWNDYYQRDWDAPPCWYYGIIMEQRPYSVYENPTDTSAAYWDHWFKVEWFEDPDFGERYEGTDMHLHHLEICVSNTWVRICDLVLMNKYGLERLGQP